MYYRVYIFFLIGVLGSAVFLLYRADAEPYDPAPFADELEQPVRQKPPRQVAKGVYLTASAAANPQKIDEIISLIKKTELNAVVIDIKDYTGKILYQSANPQVMEFKTSVPVLRDVSALIKKLHDNGVYVIARQTVFQDPVLAAAKPAWAIKTRDGKIWRDNLKLSWVDPTKREVWDYNVGIAKEAIAFGFDEVNFDYVRFPTDGDLRTVVFASSTGKRYENMAMFYQYLSDSLRDEPAWISLDFFGFVMERHDGMSIGQRLVDAVNTTDFISPMMYPSHYPKGYLNFDNPAQHPGAVIANGMKQGIGYFTSTSRAQVRPWLQAFHMGAQYDATKIRAQIDAVERHPNGGWLLWNASTRYTVAGLKKE